MDTLIPIGYTKKPHGIKGEIKLQIEDNYLEDALNAQVLFITIKGKSTPYFIEDIRIGNSIIAKFEDIDSPEKAHTISSKELAIREKDLIPDAARELEIESLEFEDCVGYNIVDKSIGNIGIIEEIVEFPQQEMAFIQYQEREVMIPLNEAFILEIDDEKKTILMALPEGLLDL